MSKIGNSKLSLNAIAAAAILANRCVGFDDAQASVAGQPVKGVAEYAATGAGDVIAVTSMGTAFVESGGAVAVGDPIVSDSQGRAVTAAALTVKSGATAVTSTAANGAVLAGATTPDFLCGRALMAATASGQFIEIRLT